MRMGRATPNTDQDRTCYTHTEEEDKYIVFVLPMLTNIMKYNMGQRHPTSCFHAVIKHVDV